MILENLDREQAGSILTAALLKGGRFGLGPVVRLSRFESCPTRSQSGQARAAMDLPDGSAQQVGPTSSFLQRGPTHGRVIGILRFVLSNIFV